MSEQDPVDNAVLEDTPSKDVPEVEPAVESSAEAAPVSEPEPEPKAAPVPAPVPEAPVAPAVQPAPIKSNAPQQPSQHLQRDKKHITPQYARQQNGTIFGSILRKIKSVAGIGNEYSYSSRNYPNSMNPNSAYYYNGMGRGNNMPPAQQMAQSQHQPQPQHQSQSVAQIQPQQPPPPAQSQPQKNMNSQLQINPQHQKQQQEINYMQNMQNNQQLQLMNYMPNVQHNQQLQMMNYMPNVQHNQQLQMMDAFLKNNMMGGHPFFHHHQQQQHQQQTQMMMMMMMMDQQYQLQQQQAQQAMIGGPMTPGMFGNPGYNMMTMYNDRMMPQNQITPFGVPQNPYFYNHRGYEGANQSYYQNNFQPDWGLRAYFQALNNRNIYIP